MNKEEVTYEPQKSIGVELLLILNKFFKRPTHPFNLEDAGIKTFAEWEFESADRVASYYAPEFDLFKEMQGKRILDIGAGGGGKSVSYAVRGAKEVVGIDMMEEFVDQAKEFAKEKSVNNCEFILENAEATHFDEDSFDICIMNDVFEHLQNPEKVLKETYRVLKTGGKIFINSPPYFHPYGAHLSDLIGIPYVHLLFPEPVLINAYKILAMNTSSHEKRVNFRFGIVDGKEHITYINKMTIKRFEHILKNDNPFKVRLYKLIPLKKFLTFMTKTPLREVSVKTIVFVGEK